MSDPRHDLVRYGRPGFIGRFASTLLPARAERVVVRGPRGVEVGEVLVSSVESNEESGAEGEVLRLATTRDLEEAARLNARGQELFAAAAEHALPLAFVDVEVTLDGTAILHAVSWEACDATPLLDRLTARFGLPVKLLDLSRVEIARDPTGCGKPGCGSETGGCSTCGTGGGGGCTSGSCSRGSAKSAEELTAYFSDLRQKMESAGLVRTPLC